MTNADKFREVFGIYATELWAKPENEFLEWLSADFANDINVAHKSGSKGYWIGNSIGHCSVCGHEGCAPDIWDFCEDGMYCPNCGASLEFTQQSESPEIQEEPTEVQLKEGTIHISKVFKVIKNFIKESE